MTRRTNARIAGFTFLFYFAAGILDLVLSNRVISGPGIAGKLASIAQHTTEFRVTVVLTLLTSFSALVLGVTLYAITREQDSDLAMMVLACRIIEAVNNAGGIKATVALLWVATATGPNAPDVAGAHTLGAYLLRGGNVGLSAMFFAVGSTIFSWLVLRGRMIPIPLAWLGVATSILLVVGLPLQFLGLLPDSATWFLWLPLAAFEIPLALWLIIKGVAPEAPRVRA